MAAEREGRGPAATAERNQRWHFTRYILDGRSHEFFQNATVIELERKPLEVLIFLLQHAGEVCTKEELLSTVWPGRVLSETVLTKCIGRLREVLEDSDQEVIKTVYGFGYRFAAPVRVETTPAAPGAHFDFQPGAHPPARPLWSLVERLGTGGHGEAWRGRHEKTREQRVFKFAFDESSLGALKREITLFRVINDTLGPNARVVKLLDWNLEQAPYFIETEYIAGGSLIDWAQAQGGLASIPLGQRLEMVAKVAEALAAVHSVGVLHKDLKPSNVLVRPSPGGTFELLLADFGSGGVLDASALERLGITGLGFTKTISTLGITSGTPLYLAPEILAGQPFTVKADIYALGILLFQSVVGDFNRILSPGWERTIDDELLRQDIALFAEGNGALRPADADQLARQLRALETRRIQLQAKREAEARAERARRVLERARARRFGLVLAFAALTIGLVTSTVLFLKAREANRSSERAAAQSRSVTEFLSRDVFAPVSSGAEPVKNLRVTELLTRAGDQIDTRFAAQPEVAAELHYVIGRSLNEFYETAAAAAHFNRSIDLSRQAHRAGSVFDVRCAAELVYLDYALGNLRQTIGRYESTLEAARGRLDPHEIALLALRQNLAVGQFLLGDWAVARQSLGQLLQDVTGQTRETTLFLGRTHLYMGQVLIALGDPGTAQEHLRTAIQQLTATLGDRHPDVSEARDALGRALTAGGRYEEARTQLDTAEELARQWAPLTTWTVMRPKFFKGLLLLELNQPEQAEVLLAEIVGFQDAHKGEHPELDHTGPVRKALAEAYISEGQTKKAIDVLKEAVAVSAAADGAMYPVTLSIRLSLAEALLADGLDDQAREVLQTSPVIEFPQLPAAHPFFAQLARVHGLLELHAGHVVEARAWLTKALNICQSVYGTQHWRSVRARRELALLP
jgi:eukaryotic-like serine/threonine-protein kinase